MNLQRLKPYSITIFHQLKNKQKTPMQPRNQFSRNQFSNFSQGVTHSLLFKHRYIAVFIYCALLFRDFKRKNEENIGSDHRGPTKF